MDRGYSLDRGKGIRRRGQPKAVCAKCGKRGVGAERTVIVGGIARFVRECRYCQNAQVRNAADAVRSIREPTVWCPDCKGACRGPADGTRGSGKRKCSTCRGEGTVPRCESRSPSGYQCRSHAGHSGVHLGTTPQLDSVWWE